MTILKMNCIDTVKKYKEIIDKKFISFMDAKINLLEDKTLKQNYSLIKEFILNGGKRLRPVAFIMAYKGFDFQKKDIEDIYLASFSFELMHNSTLIHDDIMDEDELRRNKPTVYKSSKEWFKSNFKDKENSGELFKDISSRFGVSSAILCGNIALSLGYELISSLKNNYAFNVFNDSYRTVVDGQIMDVMTEFSEGITEEEYLGMSAKKTAELFSSSIIAGATIAGADESQIKYLKEYAVLSALAFQIRDDIMDISKDSDKGHKFCSDILQGKRNILIIKTLKLACKEDREFFISVLGKSDASDEELNKAVQIIKKSSALGYAENLSKEKINLAKKALEKSKINKESFDFFSSLSDYMIQRKV